MLDELIIANLGRDSFDALPTAATILEWQTCLRRIVFLSPVEYPLLSLQAGRRIAFYRGRQAYQFLLEVICGLHSPLLGETAVMGQFRTFRTNARFSPTSWGRFLGKLTTDLLLDARYIRHQYLQSLGSQSYGSLLRKHLNSIERIAVLGSGSLAQEILPWLSKDAEVRVFYRSKVHAKSMPKEPTLRLEQFTMSDAGWDGDGALVIAAPLNSSEIISWLELQSTSFSRIVDLRGTAMTDPLNVSQTLVRLSELFHSLSHQRKRQEQRKLLALKAIEAITERRCGRIERLCA
jgi:glutamyl-tRNA reductase